MSKKKTGAGQYRHRIEIQKNTPTTDAARQRVDNWTQFASRHGKVSPISVTDQYRLDANSEVLISHTIRIRNDSKTKQIHEGFRVVYESRIFEVQSAIDPDESRREIELRVTERSFNRTS